jgi:hypothetical protein
MATLVPTLRSVLFAQIDNKTLLKCHCIAGLLYDDCENPPGLALYWDELFTCNRL